MADQIINSDTNIAGVTYKSINAQAAIVQVRATDIASEAVIITGEPNVKLYMVTI